MARERRWVGRAPGRLDVMGGLGNYMGGLVCEATTAEATWVTIERRSDARILVVNPQMRDAGWKELAEFSLADLTGDERVRELIAASPGVHWTAYVLGAFFLLKEWFPALVTCGANVFIRSEIPMRKGAGSSSAVAVAAMKTAAIAYGIELAGVELANACQWVELIIADSAAGVVDPASVVLGSEGHLLPLECQPCQPQPPIRLPAELRLWGVYSGTPTGAGARQEAARAAAFMAHKLICDWEGLLLELDERSQIPRWVDRRWNGYLANVQPSLFRSNYEQRLPESLTGADYLEPGQIHIDPFTQVQPDTVYRIRACARNTVEENLRTRLFVELIKAGSGFEQAGELMYQSHYGYTECGLGCEAADQIVNLVREEGVANGLYGAKITGAGGGGVVAVLGGTDSAPAFRRVVERFGECRKIMPYIFEGTSMGADRFGVTTLEE